MFTNSRLNSRPSTNMSYVEETDFCIVPPNTIIWEDELPFKKGDVFPPDFVKERASVYKTNEKLYKGEYDGIYDDLISFNDRVRDMMTNYPVLHIIPDLPDFRVCTEMWCDLLGAKQPKIDGSDVEKVSKVSAIMNASNFAIAYQSAVRGALLMYGNAVFRVDRLRGGNPKIVEMPVKNWIPFVNKDDITTIDVNCFFNIFKDKGGNHYCDFLLYHEDGKIEKITFEYFPESSTLGVELERKESQAFGGLGVSPIVVFTGQRVNRSVYGEDAYKKWDAAVASSMRAYGTILVLLERLKEIYRVLPEGATQRDENLGITYMQQTGAIMYNHNSDKGAPVVQTVVPEVDLDSAIKAYKETLNRLSRDTGLAYAIFDPKELGTNMSAKALKTSMFRTELQAKSMSTLILQSTKQLIVKLALAVGVDLDMSEFSLQAESGFVQDIETLTEIVQKRVKGEQTMSIADAIALLDDIPMSEAEAKAKELLGIKVDKPIDTNVTESGDGSVVSDLGMTYVSTGLDDTDSGGSKEPVKFYPLGGPNING